MSDIIEKLEVINAPWTAKTEVFEIGTSSIGAYKLRHESVFDCKGDRILRCDNKVNSILIASAPEMLKALIEEVKYQEYICFKEGISLDGAYFDMKNIIEKATGKSWKEIKELIE